MCQLSAAEDFLRGYWLLYWSVEKLVCFYDEFFVETTWRACYTKIRESIENGESILLMWIVVKSFIYENRILDVENREAAEGN